MRSEGRDTSVRGDNPRFWLAAALVMLALASTALCGYRFGVADQAQYLVQVIALEDPAALADDPYTSAFASLGSLFWVAFAALTSEQSRPLAALATTLLVATASASLLWLTGRSLIRVLLAGRRECDTHLALAALAFPLLFAVPKEQNWFGLVSLSDIELTATLAVMPLVFATILLFLRQRPLLALACAAAAAPIHAQTAAYLLAATWLAALLTRRDNRDLAILAALALIGAAGVAAATWLSRVQAAALPSYESIGLGLYNELINPLTAPAASWASALGIIALGLAALLGIARLSSPPRILRRLALWGAASLALPAAGLTLLALGVSEPFLWKLMIGRALALPQIVALILIATWCAAAIAHAMPLRAALVLAMTTLWFLPSLGVAGAAPVLALMALAMLAPPLRAPRPAIPARPRMRLALAPAALGLAAIATAAFAHRPFPWLTPGLDPAWHDAQSWARHNSPPGALFVTPPHLSDWRVGAHRPTFGEIKDGCLLFYTGHPVLEWSDRMALLGMSENFDFREAGDTAPPELDALLNERYERAVLENIATLCDAAPDVYIVAAAGAWADAPRAPGARLWSNDRFEIRRLTTGALARADRTPRTRSTTATTPRVIHVASNPAPAEPTPYAP